jgi:hypothetical protein
LLLAVVEVDRVALLHSVVVLAVQVVIEQVQIF